jgi:hypothetical protein
MSFAGYLLSPGVLDLSGCGRDLGGKFTLV